MAGHTVNGSGNGARSGAQALALLAAPLNASIVRALAKGGMKLTDFSCQAGTPAQSTLRTQLRLLVDGDVLRKRRQNRFPGALEYELSASGRDLLFVIGALQQWLDDRADGPLQLGSDEAKATIKALADGWSATMVRALAAGPLSLTELDGLIAAHNYPSLERRLATMRLAGLLEPRPNAGRGTPYAVAERLRRAVAPLLAAARWERSHRRGEAPCIGRIDIEAMLLLAIPLGDLEVTRPGSCRMAVELSKVRRSRLAGVTVDVIDSGAAICTTELRSDATTWAHGDVSAWLDALVDGADQRLEYGGDCALAQSLVNGMHSTLFRASGSRQSVDQA